jgi:2-amino-4-hydroxy-6-hydroxymethyldihydropteridine diphosphokinase
MDDWAVIALGSNLGDSPAIVRDAMERLATLSTEPLLRSSLWDSTPVDCPPGSPRFVNAVVALRPLPGQTPESLLVQLQELERAFGRRPKVLLNEARVLDLDLIAFGNERRVTDTLTLPHPRATQRRFVLQPLAEIAPEWIIPGQTMTVAALLARLQTDESLRRLDSDNK